MLPSTTIIETQRCRLRKVTAEDIPFVFSASQHPGFCDGMQWEPPAVAEELRIALEKNEAAWLAGQAYAFTVENRDTASRLGRISIHREDGSRWSVGFWTHPEDQGQGYMTEAVSALTQFAFEHLKATEIHARHALWNIASRRVLEKTGFQLMGHLPQGFKKKGLWVAEDLLRLTGETRKEL